MFPVWSVTYVPGLYLMRSNRPLERASANPRPCLEGTRQVPRGFQPCCDRFEASTTACVLDIRFEWWPTTKQWVIRIADGVSCALKISFCPYCGTALAGQLVGKRRARAK